jgi:hypothetical protein
MFGSVYLVGVAAAGGCLRKDCKTARKRREEEKNRLSLTTNNTPWRCNSIEAADECLFGRVEQGGGSITLALHMQAACRRQPLKRDLCCSTCTIFHLDSVIGHVSIVLHLFMFVLVATQPVDIEKWKEVSSIRCRAFSTPVACSRHYLIRAHIEMLVCSSVLVYTVLYTCIRQHRQYRHERILHPPASSPRPTSHALSPLTATTGKT